MTLVNMSDMLYHACGVPVEGELGYVPGVEGDDARIIKLRSKSLDPRHKHSGMTGVLKSLDSG
jgi:fructose/tagatose bisphosphate aldolase